MKKLFLAIFSILLLFGVSSLNTSAQSNRFEVTYQKSAQSRCEFAITIELFGFPTGRYFAITTSSDVNRHPDCPNIEPYEYQFDSTVFTDASGYAKLQQVVYGIGRFNYRLKDPYTNTLYADRTVITGVEYTAPITTQPTVEPAAEYRYCDNTISSNFAIGVPVEVVNIRKEIREYPTTGSIKIKKDDVAIGVVLYIKQGPVCNNQGLWWRVNDEYGHYSGWVKSDNLIRRYDLPIKPVIYIDLPYGTAATLPWISALNIRENPSVLSLRKGKILPQEIVEVTGKNLSGSWIKIRTKDGLIGWICHNLVYDNIELNKLPIYDNSENNCHSGN